MSRFRPCLDSPILQESREKNAWDKRVEANRAPFECSLSSLLANEMHAVGSVIEACGYECVILGSSLSRCVYQLQPSSSNAGRYEIARKLIAQLTVWQDIMTGCLTGEAYIFCRVRISTGT
jgi:hypothetical protein